MKRLFILDGHSLIYRSIFSPAPLLRSAAGEPTKGPYLLLQSIARLIREWKPIDYLVVACDAQREALLKRVVDPDYKRNRRVSDGDDKEEIRKQAHLSMEMLKALKLPLICCPGYEADDIIATLVSRYSRSAECFIVTTDKDLHQLVKSGVHCLNIFDRGGFLTTPIEVEERWGVPPTQVADVQTLAGDPTDGVSGVRGIGPKRAARLVAAYGSAAAVLAAAPALQPRDVGGRATLAELRGLTHERLSKLRALVRLNYKVPMPISAISELAFTGLDLQGARPMLNYLGFKRWSGLTTAS